MGLQIKKLLRNSLNFLLSPRIGPEFIKMIQKNNKITYIYFYLCWRGGGGGGQDKPAWTACPPGVKITRVGGKISQDSLPPGGQAVQGGKVNCYTGIQSLDKYSQCSS